MAEPNLRLLCHEGKLDDLLGDLALHRLDVVLSDRPAPVNPNIKLYSHNAGVFNHRLVRHASDGAGREAKTFRHSLARRAHAAANGRTPPCAADWTSGWSSAPFDHA
jgi:hypothetical protein